jgi:calcineurin-like phosphoesterase family protein
MSKEYLIGDLHMYDESIINYESRPFENADTAVWDMVRSWNSVVEENDTVYVLGDFFYEGCSEEHIATVINRLNGRIILIAGNHDMKLLPMLRKYIEIIEYPIIKDNFWIMSHEPMYVNEASPYANVFAHVHNNPMYRNVSSRSFCVSAERINYTPILLEDVKSAVLNYKNESEIVR